MYYANIQGSTIYIHDARTGEPYFTIGVRGALTSYNVNGNTLTVCYNDGRVEVYDLKSRSRLR
jgi:hypothetical protein